MQCNEVMSRDVKFVTQDQPIHLAAAMMRDTNVGFLPVCDDERNVVGILTDRDISNRLVAAQRSSDTAVRDIMSSEVTACAPTDDLHHAEGLMQEHQVARLVCVDTQGKLVGVVGLADVAKRDDSTHVQSTVQQVKANGDASLVQ